MRFFAFIDPKSAIHKQWRAGNRISGLLDGALFRWNPVKRIFEAAELPDEAIGKFLVRQDQAVILETLRVLPEELQQDKRVLEQQGVEDSGLGEQQLVKAPVEQQANEPEQQDAAVPEQQQDDEPQQVDELPPEPVQKPLSRRRVLPE